MKSDIDAGPSKTAREKATEEARKYKTAREFRESSPYWYNKSSEHGWLDEFDWLERKRRRFTRAYLEETARRYDSMDRFYKECFNEYRAALKTGQLIEFTWLECTSQPCTWEDAAAAAMRSGSFDGFRKDCPKLYLHAARRRWLGKIKELFGNSPASAAKPAGPLTNEECNELYERIVAEDIARKKKAGNAMKKPGRRRKPAQELMGQTIPGQDDAIRGDASLRETEKCTAVQDAPVQDAPEAQEFPAQGAAAPEAPEGVFPEAADLVAVLVAERGSRPARKSAETILSETYGEIDRGNDYLLESMNEVAGGDFYAAPVDKDIYYGAERPRIQYDESDY